MSFYSKKHLGINILSIKEEDIGHIISSLDLLKNKSSEDFSKFDLLECLIIGKYQEGDAIAATFVEEKVIVITPSSFKDIDFIASVLVHEITHIKHYTENPEEYSNQKRAEELAFGNEIEFLRKLKRDDLIEEAEKVQKNLLSFLDINETTTNKEENELKREDISMNTHKKLLDQYLKNNRVSVH